MKIAVLVNRSDALKPSQTTTQLVETAVRAGHTVWVVGVGDLELVESTGPLPEVRAHARRAERGFRTTDIAGGLAAPALLPLDAVDTVLVRTNPGRDPRRWAQSFALECLEILMERGVSVVNRPEGIRRLGGKPGCMLLPAEIRPRTCITRNPTTILAFLEKEERCVVKPATGTHGQGVFVLRADDPNVRTAVEVLAEHGMVVVQEWLPEATEGDIRLFMVNGEIFSIDGKVAAVRRRPARGELRSNVHLGGTPEPVQPDARLERVAELAGPVLTRLGVAVAGLDCIGGKVVEINANAPGGLGDCTAFYGVDFFSALLERVL